MPLCHSSHGFLCLCMSCTILCCLSRTVSAIAWTIDMPELNWVKRISFQLTIILASCIYMCASGYQCWKDELGLRKVRALIQTTKNNRIFNNISKDVKYRLWMNSFSKLSQLAVQSSVQALETWSNVWLDYIINITKHAPPQIATDATTSFFGLLETAPKNICTPNDEVEKSQ